MEIKVSKTILESALLCKAKNDIRYYINGVCFKSDGRVSSTNGHKLFIGENHQSKIDADIIIDIGKSPTQKYNHTVIDTDTGMVTYFDAFQIKVGVGLISVIDGKFPDVDRVIPKENRPANVIGFNAKYLVDLDKIAKIFNPKWEGVTFELDGPHNAGIARLKSPVGEKGMVIVMPMRVD